MERDEHHDLRKQIQKTTKACESYDFPNINMSRQHVTTNLVNEQGIGEPRGESGIQEEADHRQEDVFIGERKDGEEESGLVAFFLGDKEPEEEIQNEETRTYDENGKTSEESTTASTSTLEEQPTWLNMLMQQFGYVKQQLNSQNQQLSNQNQQLSNLQEQSKDTKDQLSNQNQQLSDMKWEMKQELDRVSQHLEKFEGEVKSQMDRMEERMQKKLENRSQEIREEFRNEIQVQHQGILKDAVKQQQQLREEIQVRLLQQAEETQGQLTTQKEKIQLRAKLYTDQECGKIQTAIDRAIEQTKERVEDIAAEQDAKINTLEKELDQSNGSRSSSPSLPNRSKSSGPSKTQRQCIIYSALIITATIFFAYTFLSYGGSHKTGKLDSLALALGLHKNIYVVVIDAGSTGSRILALSFHQSVLDGSLKLEGERFIQVAPGLSSFADRPKQGAEKIKELIDQVIDFVPESLRSSTPIVLRATAGLRLLPLDQADALLNEVKSMFSASPFYTSEKSVAIMDGSDEGIFSWVNVNFLSDKLFGGPGDTYAALDLGGGSTQITFALEDPSRLKAIAPEDVHTFNILNNEIAVYTHSYLGLGLMAARKAILSKGNPLNATILKSECINPIIKDKVFKYGGISYTVQGPENPEIIQKRIKGSEVVYEQIPVVRIKECSAIITDYIRGQKVEKPVELLDHDITAFSYFYDRAIESGLADPFIGGTVTVQQFHSTAESICHNPNVDQPFMCIDLMFITILLEDGYGLKPDTKLKMLKTIDGHEVSWSLGMAYHVVQNGL